MTQWAPVASVLKHRRPRRQLPPQHLRVMMKGSRWKKCIMKKWALECQMRPPLHPPPAPDRHGAGITQASNRRRGWWKRTGLRRARGGGLCPRRPAAAADPGASLASVRGSTEDCIQLHQHKNTAAVGRGYWRKWEVKLLLGLSYIVMYYVSLYWKYNKTSNSLTRLGHTFIKFINGPKIMS